MNGNIWIYILVTALVTYLIRVTPLVLIRREITNPVIRSFLFYVPYVTLAVMTFPAIIEATQSIWSGLGALLVGSFLALRGKSLFVVAEASCLTVFCWNLSWSDRPPAARAAALSLWERKYTPMNLVRDHRSTLRATHIAGMSQAVAMTVPPLLFLTFQSTYGIPLAEITWLITLNFLIQLMMDLAASRFVDRVGYRPCIMTGEILSGLGLAGPWLSPRCPA